MYLDCAIGSCDAGAAACAAGCSFDCVPVGNAVRALDLIGAGAVCDNDVAACSAGCFLGCAAEGNTARASVDLDGAGSVFISVASAVLRTSIRLFSKMVVASGGFMASGLCWGFVFCRSFVGGAAGVDGDCVVARIPAFLKVSRDWPLVGPPRVSTSSKLRGGGGRGAMRLSLGG